MRAAPSGRALPRTERPTDSRAKYLPGRTRGGSGAVRKVWRFRLLAPAQRYPAMPALIDTVLVTGALLPGPPPALLGPAPLTADSSLERSSRISPPLPGWHEERLTPAARRECASPRGRSEKSANRQTGRHALVNFPERYVVLSARSAGVCRACQLWILRLGLSLTRFTCGRSSLRDQP